MIEQLHHSLSPVGGVIKALRSTAAVSSVLAAGALSLALVAAPASAQTTVAAESGSKLRAARGQAECGPLPGYEALQQVLRDVVAPGDPAVNGGLGNPMWATVVDRSGAICTVVYSGDSLGDQWLGSRGISAEKAFNANAYSLPGFALSTANLYWPSQPGNSLYGLAFGNPVHEEALYRGPASTWGQPDDPLIGRRIGGTIYFAGGLPLYTADGELIGALGLSGDQSCTDHIIAWKIRHHLNLDNVPAGVSPAGNDNAIFDLTVDPQTGQQTSPSGYGHPRCGETAAKIVSRLSEAFPTGTQE